MPSITVLIAAYNQGQYLEQAIRSALDQTLDPAHYEMIVIDDGSTDCTKEIAARLVSENPGRVRLLSQANSGLVAVCNRGLREASGELFLRLDSDDWLEPQALATLNAALDAEPSAVAAISDHFIETGGAPVSQSTNPDDVFSLIACGVLMRTQLLRDVGGYRPLFWEEYDLFLRLRGAGKFAHVARPLYHYRKHDSNMTNQERKRVNGWIELASMHSPGWIRACGDLSRVPELREALK